MTVVDRKYSPNCSLEGEFISQVLPPHHKRKIILEQNNKANRKIILGWREYNIC